MKAIPGEEQKLLDCLTEAVTEALERKRRLGQYAVVWRDGKPVFIGDNPPECSTTPQPRQESHSNRGDAAVIIVRQE